MKIFKDQCVGCETCYGYCPYKYDKYVHVCDCCGEEIEGVYQFKNMEVCSYCQYKLMTGEITEEEEN